MKLYLIQQPTYDPMPGDPPFWYSVCDELQLRYQWREGDKVFVIDDVEALKEVKVSFNIG